MDTPEEAAALVASSLRLRLQGGSVLAVPIPPDQVGPPQPDHSVPLGLVR